MFLATGNRIKVEDFLLHEKNIQFISFEHAVAGVDGDKIKNN
jgi:hypothetical protein